ncbi:hypothetical protein QBS70_02600, partial [Cronobacter sakazakii]|nr:hypothetical protein [Cronobacter sakazakii]
GIEVLFCIFILPQLYERLEGFDTKYYMYCEDIDICLRANLIIGAKLTYIPSVRAIHLAAHIENCFQKISSGISQAQCVILTEEDLYFIGRFRIYNSTL